MSKKVILFVAEDGHFYEHLLPIARSAKEKGYIVEVLTKEGGYKTKVEEQGFKVLTIDISRFCLNPFKELKLIFNLIGIYRREKPNIVQHFGIKPIIYGSIALLFSKTERVVNTFLGMGFIFLSEKIWVKVIRFFICNILKLVSINKKYIYITQNKDDAELLRNLRIASKDRIVNQCSVGIEPDNFKFLHELPGKIIFALVGRMIVDKGVGEFVTAANLLNKNGLFAEFWLVGAPDENIQDHLKKSN
ncbi:alpha-D-QuiNAc alpha-1,3-galactosyltransferase [Reticulomyxa filosa]|uniref:Alpha-D-QuiNAc alpha-1,3-galactosyltransferase n=1 Tax=Reticulomyxa filosa TaxID=46433 RepID=X6MDC9_RETFI|nr:alpha-D-QuiNAc alpha-1,3-galactosyltransferase [Reticulomyxa filosa]|eukprot:ETO11055.1 alpha-D-QuiNAc alpha-1,3-galactosyltransferase [Reticulomyxa filosa]